MKKLLLLFLIASLTHALYSCSGCLDTNCFLNRCANKLYTVECACECWRYSWAPKRAECLNCGHYHMPYDKNALEPDYIVKASKKRVITTDFCEHASKKASKRPH